MNVNDCIEQVKSVFGNGPEEMEIDELLKQSVVLPLIEQLDDGQLETAEEYISFMEDLFDKGDADVREALKNAMETGFEDQPEAWMKFGRRISYPFKNYINESTAMDSITVYFKTINEFEGTDYLEFVNGQWDGSSYWNETSMYLSADMDDQIDFDRYIKEVIPEYDSYGVTEVDEDQWDTLVHNVTRVGGPICAAVYEINRWVKKGIEKESVITILGL